MEELNEKAGKAHITALSLDTAVPAVVDAGTDVSLQVKATCDPGCNLRGGLIRIVDSGGDTITNVNLSVSGEGIYKTETFAVRVPALPGEYTWTILFPAQRIAEEEHGESTATFSFTVRPHQISLSVWGIPIPVNKGEKFNISIGAKCSAGCSLAALPMVIMDGGRTIGQGVLGNEILPQTSGTYWTEQEIEAPSDETVHTWAVRAAISALELPHEAEPVNFVFRTAAPPRYTVTIEVVNKYDKMPLDDAYIMLGLYKTATDKQGIAIVAVPEGPQELYVTKTDYISFQDVIDVTADATIRAELEFFPQL
jgi:hypothetical protein